MVALKNDEKHISHVKIQKFDQSTSAAIYYGSCFDLGNQIDMVLI